MKERHKQIYDYIVRYITDNGYPPDLTEIAEGIGLRSKSVISENLREMDKLGIINVERGRSRCIRVPGYHFIPDSTNGEKQIPQKIDYWTRCDGDGICPICGDLAKTNYCGNCGQKLDWTNDAN